MIAKFAALLALAASSVVAVTIDPQLCYTLTKDNQQNYLDSADSVLKVENHPDRNALIRDNDKGVVFRFPNGDGGPVVNQAHNDHFVGLSGSDFHTDVGGGDGSKSTVKISGNGVTVESSGPTFIGSDGKASSTSFVWQLDTISCANL